MYNDDVLFSCTKKAILLHNKEWNNKLKEIKPDIIAITGDFIDSSHTDLNISMKFIKDVKGIAPIYYVTGNHEARINCFKSRIIS